MGCCGFSDAVNRQFSERRVGRELERFRRKGAGETTRMLLDGLARVNLTPGTVLDIGAGLGGMTFALLDRGAESAVVVEASDAYADALAAEVTRRRRREAVQLVRGDFLDVQARLPRADLVTLDRVVCCYPLYVELLRAALDRAGQAFAYSYPRDRWYVRAGATMENAVRRLWNPFRTFVHPQAAMERLVTSAGFDLVARAHTLVWQADVFVRRSAAAN
jgi:magnesium-protoporphyrin O-methyltransferase